MLSKLMLWLNNENNCQPLATVGQSVDTNCSLSSSRCPSRVGGWEFSI